MILGTIHQDHFGQHAGAGFTPNLGSLTSPRDFQTILDHIKVNPDAFYIFDLGSKPYTVERKSSLDPKTFVVKVQGNNVQEKRDLLHQFKEYFFRQTDFMIDRKKLKFVNNKDDLPRELRVFSPDEQYTPPASPAVEKAFQNYLFA